jgi:D-amino-acid dehydrogenase
MDRVVVVGGGIVGASAAYRLAGAGAAVSLVDAAHPGRATDAGAGIVCPAASRTPPGPWYPMAAAAVGFYPGLLSDLAEDGETDTGYEAVGGLFVATSDEERRSLAATRDLIEARGRDGMGNVGEISLLEPEEVRALFPPIADGVAAIHVSGGARLDGRRVRDAMVRAAARRGAEVLPGTATLRIERDRVRAVDVDGRAVPCGAVILATGAWPPLVTGAAVVPWPIRPERGQIAHLDLPAAETESWPFVVGYHTHYLLTFPPNRVVAGATREAGVSAVRSTAAGVREVLSEALRVAPGLAEGAVAEVRVGIRPTSLDGLPVVGPTAIEGVHLANGLGTSGLMMGPFVGAIAADLVLGIDPPGPDLAPFVAERFADLPAEEGSA